MKPTPTIKINPLSAILFLSIIGIAACSTVSFKQYPCPSDKLFESSSTILGVSAIAEPMLKEEDQVTYFGVNMIEKGLLPIYLAVKNNNHEDAFILCSESITMQSEKDVSTANNAITENNQLQSILNTTALICMSPLLALIAEEVASKKGIIGNNLELNRFRTKTISPGQQVSGFLYADWNKINSKDKVDICFQLLNPETEKSFPYCLNIFLRGVIQ
jgi:hypothetical protein